MELVEKMFKECKESPLMCAILLVLFAAIVQNCVMDIGLGPYLGMDSFSNLLEASF